MAYSARSNKDGSRWYIYDDTDTETPYTIIGVQPNQKERVYRLYKSTVHIRDYDSIGEALLAIQTGNA